MKLYSKPGACSTAVHIVLQWAGGPFEVEILDGAAMKAPAFLAINPAGAVPALVDGDFVLTQNAAIMGYIADTHPQAGLAGDGSPRPRAEGKRPAGQGFQPVQNRYTGDRNTVRRTRMRRRSRGQAHCGRCRDTADRG